jgi:tRNA pseudouridine55 synthase
MARAGETVIMAEREVTLHELDLTTWDGTDPERPIAIVDVTCSAGTYVRALARDLGEAVGSAAYLGALVRTASGPFELANAVPLDDVRAAAADGPEGLTAMLRPIDDGLESFPIIELSETELVAVARGQYVRPAAGIPSPAAHYRLRSPDGGLAAIASADGTRLAPDKVFVTPAVPAASAAPAEPVG